MRWSDHIKKYPLEAKRITAYLPDNPDLYENLSGIQYLNFIADVFGISSEKRNEKISEYGKELASPDDSCRQLQRLQLPLRLWACESLLCHLGQVLPFEESLKEF